MTLRDGIIDIFEQPVPWPEVRHRRRYGDGARHRLHERWA
jgi:hypothetical protein